MLCRWRLWVDCKNEEKSRKLVQRFSAAIGRQLSDVRIEREDDGHSISLAVELQSERWNDAVVEALKLGQSIADRWNVTGGTTSDNEWFSAGAGAQQLDLFTIAGIRSAAWELERREP